MNKRILFFGLLPLIVLILAGSFPSAAGLARQDGLPPIPLPVWRSEVAAPGVALSGQGALSMALDADDTPYLLYYSPATGQLRLAVRGSDQWTSDLVANVAAEGLELALAIGPDGVPQVAFTDSAAGRLVVGKRIAGQWALETIGPAGHDLALAVGQDNRPQLIQIQDKRVVYWTNETGQWSGEPVSAAGAEVDEAFMALDGADRPHVIYWAGMAVRQGAGDWDIEALPFSNIIAATVGPDGEPYLLTLRVEEMRGPPPPIYVFIVTLRERHGDEWSAREMDNSFMPIEDITERLIVDEQRRLSLVFRDSNGVTRCYQRDENDQWSDCRAFHLWGDVGLAIGHDHLPRLSGHTAGDLVFLRREIIWLDEHILLPVVPDL